LFMKTYVIGFLPHTHTDTHISIYIYILDASPWAMLFLVG